TGEEHDLRAVAAQPLRPVGAVGEEIEQFTGGQVTRERRVPDLEAGFGGVPGGGFQPVLDAARDAHRGAVQVRTDDLHLSTYDVDVERLPGAVPRSGDEPGVVGDPLAAHAHPLLVPPGSRTHRIGTVRTVL